MEELKLSVKSQLGVIEWSNFEELKSQLKEETGKYHGIVLKEEDITEAKATVANFRKLSTAINDERKSIKKTYNDPLKQFEDKVKELDGIILELTNEINLQLDDFEKNRIKEKQNEIEELFNGMNFPCSLDMVYENSWENKTVKISSVKKDLEERLFSINQELGIIRSNVSESRERAEEIYLCELDLSKALTHINQYEQNKRDIEERARIKAEQESQRKIEEEKERIRKEERAKAQAEFAVEEKLHQSKTMQEIVAEVITEPSYCSYPTYRINANEMQLTLFEDYLEENGIEFERLN